MNLQRFGIATALLAATVVANVANGANILADKNPSFEQTERPFPDSNPNFFWPTASTWTRDTFVTPYSSADAVEGTKSVVLYQYAQGNGAINTNRYRIVNTTPIETGKTYTFSFFAKRVFDASAPDDSAKGNVQTFVPARLVANVWNVNSGQSVIAEDLGSTVFNPGINGTTDAPVSGDWTQYSINFTPTVTPSGNAAGTGNLFIQFRILDETLAFNPANVKYAVDNLSVTVPEPGSLALLSGAGLLALRRRRRD